MKMKLRFFVAALAATLAINSAAAQATQADVAAKFNEAAALINNRQFAEALPILEQVVELGVEIPEALENVQQAQNLIPTCHFRVAVAAASAGQMDAAAEGATKALETAELYGNTGVMANAKRLLAQVYGKQAAEAFNGGDYAKAIEIYGKSFTANPRDAQAGLNLAMSYDKNNEREKAVEAYNAVVALGESEEATKAREALAFYHLADLNAASQAKDWAKVIELGEAAAAAQATPEAQSDVYFILGAAYQNSENTPQAIEALRKVTAGDNVAAARALVGELSK